MISILRYRNDEDKKTNWYEVIISPKLPTNEEKYPETTSL